MQLDFVSLGVGALIGGVVNALVGRYASFQESKGMALALRAEIDALLALLALRDYLGVLAQMIARLENDQYQPTTADLLNILVNQDFFSTYHALAPRIGLLGELAGPVTRLYVAAKGIVEDFKTSRDAWERVMAGGPVPARETLLDYNRRVRALIASFPGAGAEVSARLSRYAKLRLCRWF